MSTWRSFVQRSRVSQEKLNSLSIIVLDVDDIIVQWQLAAYSRTFQKISNFAAVDQARNPAFINIVIVHYKPTF